MPPGSCDLHVPAVPGAGRRPGKGGPTDEGCGLSHRASYSGTHGGSSATVVSSLSAINVRMSSATG